MSGETATLGDFGAGEPRSDSQIDKQAAAQKAAAGEWAFLAVGNDTIGWHIPDTGATRWRDVNRRRTRHGTPPRWVPVTGVGVERRGLKSSVANRTDGCNRWMKRVSSSQ